MSGDRPPLDEAIEWADTILTNDVLFARGNTGRHVAVLVEAARRTQRLERALTRIGARCGPEHVPGCDCSPCIAKRAVLQEGGS